jgi:phosphoribosylaminoimidazolecarboxamide formyltransferase / IMP cyclohydrolase
VSKAGCTLQDALEQIDIGGPAMLRAAAKNFPNVVVVSDPARYAEILTALQSDSITDTLRRELAADAFQHVSTYDALVAEYLRGPSERFPAELTIPGRQAFALRYGENPHQRASAYRRPTPLGEAVGILDAAQLQGKELSYNNILDSDAAVRVLQGISGPTCAIVKHAVPCGMATRKTVADAFAAALASDPISAFGGIVALNQPVDAETASQVAEIFFEVVIAPQFSDQARTILGSKKRLRLLELPAKGWIARPDVDVRSISGGLLLQERDTGIDSAETWSVATTNAPSSELQADLAFAWHACRFVKSNAIVLVRDRALVGVGPGQPNRVDSVNLAITRAGDRAHGSVLASDAFFPFADGVEAAIRAGVAAIIQPGGSIRDDEVVAACNNASVPMIFTGVRHFYH